MGLLNSPLCGFKDTTLMALCCHFVGSSVAFCGSKNVILVALKVLFKGLKMSFSGFKMTFFRIKDVFFEAIGFKIFGTKRIHFLSQLKLLFCEISFCGCKDISLSF